MGRSIIEGERAWNEGSEKFFRKYHPAARSNTPATAEMKFVGGVEVRTIQQTISVVTENNLSRGERICGVRICFERNGIPGMAKLVVEVKGKGGRVSTISEEVVTKLNGSRGEVVVSEEIWYR